MTEELKVIKLTNGDEIIGFIQDGSHKDTDNDEITLSHMIFIKGAMRIVQQYDESVKGHTLYLVDWMPTGQSQVLPIQKSHILTLDVPNMAVEEHYYTIMEERFPEDKIDTAEIKKQEQLQQLRTHKFSDDDIQ